MADVFGLSGGPDENVSSPDTGKGSQLKTGGRRSHNMPKSASNRLIDCMKKAKTNTARTTCKRMYSIRTKTTKQHGFKPKG